MRALAFLTALAFASPAFAVDADERAAQTKRIDALGDEHAVLAARLAAMEALLAAELAGDEAKKAEAAARLAALKPTH